MTDIKTLETMRAVLEPSCYGGPGCDEIEHAWQSYCVGDRDSGPGFDPLTLDPKTFPPGTIVTVQEPACPECKMVRMADLFSKPGESVWPQKCDCGFDWDAWTLNNYS